MGTSSAPGRVQNVARWLLTGLLLVAGVGHFVRTDDFLGQVPTLLPFPHAIVIVSGLVEIALAIALIIVSGRQAQVGWVVAVFFVLVFPGNISQFATGNDAFGLDSDFARGIRLLFQPVLVVWALWCTGAWHDWRARRNATARYG